MTVAGREALATTMTEKMTRPIWRKGASRRRRRRRMRRFEAIVKMAVAWPVRRAMNLNSIRGRWLPTS